MTFQAEIIDLDTVRELTCQQARHPIHSILAGFTAFQVVSLILGVPDRSVQALSLFPPVPGLQQSILSASRSQKPDYLLPTILQIRPDRSDIMVSDRR